MSDFLISVVENKLAIESFKTYPVVDAVALLLLCILRPYSIDAY